MITPENEMKWDATEPNPGQFTFGAADTIVNHASAHGQSIRGHTLVWHNQLPGWVNNTTSGTALRQVGIVHGAAPRRSIASIVRTKTPAAAAGRHAAHVEDRAVEAPQREVVAVAVRNRARRIDELRSDDAADNPHSLALRDGKPRREAARDREIRRVH